MISITYRRPSANGIFIFRDRSSLLVLTLSPAHFSACTVWPSTPSSCHSVSSVVNCFALASCSNTVASHNRSTPLRLFAERPNAGERDERRLYSQANFAPAGISSVQFQWRGSHIRIPGWIDPRRSGLRRWHEYSYVAITCSRFRDNRVREIENLKARRRKWNGRKLGRGRARAHIFAFLLLTRHPCHCLYLIAWNRLM